MLGQKGHVELFDVLAVGRFHSGRPAQQGDEVGDDFREVAGAPEVPDFYLGESDVEGRGDGLGDFHGVGFGGKERADGGLGLICAHADSRGCEGFVACHGVFKSFACGLGFVTLAHLGAIGIEDQRHVAVLRRAEGCAIGAAGRIAVVAKPRERLLHGYVLGRVDQVLLGPHDVGHAHEFIINDDGEVIGGEPIGLADDKVVNLAGGEGDVAEDLVVYDDRLIGHGEAQHVALAGLCAGPAVGVEDAELHIGRAAVLVILLGRDGGFATNFQFLGSFEGGVGPARAHEMFEVRVVDCHALGLKIGADVARVTADGLAVGGGERGAIIPVDAEPGEIIKDAAGGFIAGAGLIGVLDADHEAAIDAVRAGHAAGKGPTKQGRACPADVQVPGGGGGETSDEW